MANVSFAIVYDMAKERPTVRRRRILGTYVSDRLNREYAEEAKRRGKEKAHGFNAMIARETGFTPAHVSSARRSIRKVGEDFGEAMAEYWKIGTLDDIMREAVAYVERDRVIDRVPDTLRARIFATTLARSAKIPEKYIEYVVYDPWYNDGRNNERDHVWWLDEMKNAAKEDRWINPRDQRDADKKAAVDTATIRDGSPVHRKKIVDAKAPPVVEAMPVKRRRRKTG